MATLRSRTTIPVPEPPDHYTLYKALSRGSLSEDEPLIYNDGRINHWLPHTDDHFNSRCSGTSWSFTPEAATAHLQRSYAAQRCPFSETWIISVKVPRLWLDRLRVLEVWHGNNWKQFIWNVANERVPAGFS
jgi:hypothetical protein